MFQFAQPQHLYVLLLVPLHWGLVLLWRHWQRSALGRLGDTSRIFAAVSPTLFWLKNVLLSTCIVLLGIAWANPQRGTKMQTITQKSADVFIALDISQSMLCADVKPNRLKLAQIFSEKLVQALEGERIGLIFFAGNAFLQMPLSTDYAFIIQQLREASTDQITQQGTAIPAALNLASKSFEDSPGGGRAVIVVTDGENHDEDAVDAASDALDEGVVVYTVGAGTAEGGAIPDPVSGAPKRDASNEIVRTKLDENALRKIALSGGGRSFRLQESGAAIAALQREIGNLEKRELAVRSSSEMESRYQWFLLPALLLLLLDMGLPWRRTPFEKF
jgi:Ca-activated chloride channel homolog